MFFKRLFYELKLLNLNVSSSKLHVEAHASFTKLLFAKLAVVVI